MKRFALIAAFTAPALTMSLSENTNMMLAETDEALESYYDYDLNIKKSGCNKN